MQGAFGNLQCLPESHFVLINFSDIEVDKDNYVLGDDMREGNVLAMKKLIMNDLTPMSFYKLTSYLCQ